MIFQGVLSNGIIVPDEPCPLPDGTRVRIKLIDDEDLDDLFEGMLIPDPSLPPDHPHAPYNREVELAILRESIAEMNAGGGRPLDEVMAEFSLKHGL